MFKIDDYVTTDIAGGIGKIVECDYTGANFYVKWIAEPKFDAYRIIPLRLAKTKLWKYLYEEI
jgi:hypothetical protein